MTRAAAFLLIVSAVAAQAPSRPSWTILLDAPTPLEGARTFEFAASSRPRLLYVEGVRPRGIPNADAGLFLDGVDHGVVSGYEDPPGRFAATLPVSGSKGAEAPSAHVLRTSPIRDAAPGVVLHRVALIDAARLIFVLRDQGSKAMIRGAAAITSLDGLTPPRCGPYGGAPREGAAWISSDGGGELWAPLGASVAVLGRASPFRAAVRHRTRLDVAEGLVSTFLLPPDQRPDGARILEAPDPGGPFARGRAWKDAALDVGARVGPDWTATPAAEALANPDAFVKALRAFPDQRTIVTNETGRSLLPESHRQFVTVRLADQSLIHSNGPLPLLEDLRRDGLRVKAWIKLRCPEDAKLDALFVAVGAIERRFPVSGPTTLELDVEAAPGEPITLVVKGSGFTTAPPLERPFAVRILRAP